MKTNILFITILILGLSSCHKKFKMATGKFYEGLSLSHEKHFSHTYPSRPNRLKKITDDPYSYFSWKTIKFNYILKNDTVLLNDKIQTPDSNHVSIFKTIMNKELLAMDNDQYSYIRKEGNVLMNNLYFIDDYRCIYLSFDDSRAKNDQNNIPLYFDSKKYPIPKKDKKRFEQYLRGYYNVKGDSVFIHFESPVSGGGYFVNAKFQGDQIIFTSMTVPNSPTELYGQGYNANLIQFKEVFHETALPVFEWVGPVVDLIYPPQFYISTGFENHKKSTSKNQLHQEIIADSHCAYQTNDIFLIEKVEYTLDPENPYREYTLKSRKNQIECKVKEFLGLDPLGEKSLINTW